MAGRPDHPPRRVPAPRDISRLLAWLPAGVFLVYAAVFLARAGEITDTLYLNADIASGPVIAQLMSGTPDGREVVLGNYAWYEALGALLVLDELPASRFLVEVVPYLLGVLTALLAAAGVRVVTRSWWASSIAAILVLAAGPLVWACLGTWTVHGLTWLHVAALGAFVVWLATGPSRPRSLLVAAALGVLTGIATASDVLVAIGGLAPMVLAVAVVAPRSPSRRLLLTATAVCLASTAAAVVATHAIADASDIRSAGGVPIRLVETGRLGDNVDVVFRALTEVVNGRFLNAGSGISTYLHFLVALLAALAGLFVLTELLRRWRSTEASEALRLHLAFWVSAAAALVAACVFTTVPVDPTIGRYLVGVLVALAAVLPVVACRPAHRSLIGLGVAAYAAVGVLSLARGEFTTNVSKAPTASTAQAVARLAAQHDVDVAYAGYWDAAPLTWGSDFKLQVHPVRMCDETARLCPFEFHRISSWYQPRRGRRSMLIVDRTIRMLSVLAVDPRLSPPKVVTRIGQLEVAIFDYDIARGFGPPVEA